MAPLNPVPVKLLSGPALVTDETAEPATAPVQAQAPAPAAAAGVANTIDQVRELLYGDAMRQQGRRVEDLEVTLHETEQRILQRFQEMQASMDALARALRGEQSAALRAVGGTIVEMGRQIASMGEIRERGPNA